MCLLSICPKSLEHRQHPASHHFSASWVISHHCSTGRKKYQIYQWRGMGKCSCAPSEGSTQCDTRYTPYQTGKLIWLSTKNLWLKLPQRKLQPFPHHQTDQPGYLQIGVTSRLPYFSILPCLPPKTRKHVQPRRQPHYATTTHRSRWHDGMCGSHNSGHQQEERAVAIAGCLREIQSRRKKSWVNTKDIFDPALITEFHATAPINQALDPGAAKKHYVYFWGDSVTSTPIILLPFTRGSLCASIETSGTQHVGMYGQPIKKKERPLR